MYSKLNFSVHSNSERVASRLSSITLQFFFRDPYWVEQNKILQCTKLSYFGRTILRFSHCTNVFSDFEPHEQINKTDQTQIYEDAFFCMVNINLWKKNNMRNQNCKKKTAFSPKNWLLETINSYPKLRD